MKITTTRGIKCIAFDHRLCRPGTPEGREGSGGLGASVLVTLNGMRLLRVNPGNTKEEGKRPRLWQGRLCRLMFPFQPGSEPGVQQELHGVGGSVLPDLTVVVELPRKILGRLQFEPSADH